MRIKNMTSTVHENCRIIGEEKLFKSAVMVLLAKIKNEYYFVFQKRSKNVRQPGEISFPGGEVSEEDGTYRQTAIRETVEEMGLDAEQIEVIGSIGILTNPSGMCIESFIGVVELESLDDITVNQEEVEYAFLVPYKFFRDTPPEIYLLNNHITPYAEENGEIKCTFPAKELNLPEKYHGNWIGTPIKVLVYKYEKEIIWGITARLIEETIKLLEI